MPWRILPARCERTRQAAPHCKRKERAIDLCHNAAQCKTCGADTPVAEKKKTQHALVSEGTTQLSDLMQVQASSTVSSERIITSSGREPGRAVGWHECVRLLSQKPPPRADPALRGTSPPLQGTPRAARIGDRISRGRQNKDQFGESRNVEQMCMHKYLYFRMPPACDDRQRKTV